MDVEVEVTWQKVDRKGRLPTLARSIVECISKHQESES